MLLVERKVLAIGIIVCGYGYNFDIPMSRWKRI